MNPGNSRRKSIGFGQSPRMTKQTRTLAHTLVRKGPAKLWVRTHTLAKAWHTLGELPYYAMYTIVQRHVPI